MSKEIVKKETTALAAPIPELNVGADMGSLMTDYVIPRAHLQQGLSEAVTQGEAFLGDVIRSTTKEVIFTCSAPTKADTREVLRVSKENPVRVIPLAIRMLWTNFEEINGKMEYRGEEPRTAQNATLPIEYEQNGTKWKRYSTIGVFGLLESDVLAEIAEESSDNLPDMSKMLLPIYFSFKSTSFKCGKEISTYFTNILNFRSRGKDVYPFSFSLPLWCSKVENDKGTFAVWSASQATKPVSKEVFAKAKGWFDNISKGFVKVDEVQESEGSSNASSTPTNF